MYLAGLHADQARDHGLDPTDTPEPDLGVDPAQDPDPFAQPPPYKRTD